MKLNSEITDILVECCRSTKIFAKTFFPERFKKEFSHLHDQIFELIDSDAPRIAIAAPRGIGKTSIAGLAKPAQGILFRERNFIPYVGLSHDASALQTENLKRELVSNSIIKKFFGPVKAGQAKEMEESFSKKSWVAYETLVMPRGAGQVIRGILFGNSRPDLIIVDDFEDSNEIHNDELRQKLKNWFTADLLKSVDQYESNWKIIYIDTLKHEDALIQDLLDSPNWESIRLEICDDELEPTAPEFKSKESIDLDYAYHKETGQLDIFYREYRNLAISVEDAVFQQKYFNYYDPAELKYPQIEFVVIVDPAKTVKLHSAESAIVGVGIDRASACLYVHDIVARMMYPNELYDEIFFMAERLNCHIVGIEVTSLNEFITQPIKNEMTFRGKFFNLIELKARGGTSANKGKEQRIAALAPYYRQGFIKHNPNVCQPLEAQLMAFPRPRRWDIMDALAYVIEMLDIGDQYFEGPDEDPDDEDFIFDLPDEPEFVGWRTI